MHQTAPFRQRLAHREVDGGKHPRESKEDQITAPPASEPWEAGGGPLILISTHLVSVSPEKGSDSHPLPKHHLANKAGNVFHLGPWIQLSLQQWVAFKPNI